MKTRQIVGVLLLIALIVGAVFFYRSVEETPVCETIAQLRIEGDLEAAEKAARACIDEDGEHGDARVELSRIAALQGEYDEAMEWLHAALELDGETPAEYQFWKARLRFWMGEYERALGLLDRVDAEEVDAEEYAQLKAALKRATAYCDMARTHRVDGEFDEALEVAENCVAEFPDLVETRFEVARILALMDHSSVALKWLRSALYALDGEAPADALLLKARLLYWHGDYERAKAILDDVSIDEVDADEYWELHESLKRAHSPCEFLHRYRLTGDLEFAREMVLECLVVEPNYAEAWIELSRILAMEGKYDEALPWVEAAIAADGDNPDYLLWKARLLYWMGDVAAAQVILDKLRGEESIQDEVAALQAAIDRVFSVCNQIRKLRRAGELEAAQRAARQCLARNPGHVVAQAELSRILAMDRQYEEALRWIQSAIEADGGNPDYELWKARLLYWMGDYKQALAVLAEIDGDALDREDLEELEAAIARAMDAAPLVCAMVHRLRAQGDRDRAMAAAWECIRQAPHHAEAYLEVSRLLALGEDYEAAMEWAKEALREADGDETGEALLWKARLRYWKGEHGRALDLLEIIDEDHIDADAVVELRDTVRTALIVEDARPPEVCRGIEEYRDEGRLQEAEETARRCLTLVPDFVGAKVELSRVLGLQGKYEPALDWIDVALSSDDARPEHHLWKARLLFWMGKRDEAKALVKALDPDEVGRAQWEQLAWSIHNAEEAQAHLASRQRPYYHGELAYFRGSNEEGGWRNRHGLAGYPADGLYGEIHFDIFRRKWVNDQSMDTSVRGHGRYEINDRYRVEAGGSYAPGADFSPLWSAYIDPGVMFGPDLDFGLRLQRIDFRDQGGVHVIRPSVLWGFGSFFVDARYYFALEPDARNAHSVKGRLLYWPSDALQVFAGGAVGNKADYLEGYVAPERAMEGVMGLQLELNSTFDILGDIRYRHETLDEESYRLLRTTGGVRIRF